MKSSCPAKRQARNIFLEAADRIADGDQPFPAQILLTADVVVNIAAAIHGHGVDGEITAQDIFAQCISIPDRIRPVAVLAIGFAAESRDFKGLAGNDDDDDAKGFAVDLDGVPVLFGGDGPDIIRPGRGGDIIVVRFFSHKQVAHGTADDIGFKACIL